MKFDYVVVSDWLVCWRVGFVFLVCKDDFLYSVVDFDCVCAFAVVVYHVSAADCHVWFVVFVDGEELDFFWFGFDESEFSEQLCFDFFSDGFYHVWFDASFVDDDASFCNLFSGWSCCCNCDYLFFRYRFRHRGTLLKFV